MSFLFVVNKRKFHPKQIKMFFHGQEKAYLQ